MIAIKLTGNRMDHLHPRVDDRWSRSVADALRYGGWRGRRRGVPAAEAGRRAGRRGRYEPGGRRAVVGLPPDQLFPAADVQRGTRGLGSWRRLIDGCRAGASAAVDIVRRLIFRQEHPLLLLLLLDVSSVVPGSLPAVPFRVVVRAGRVASSRVDRTGTVQRLPDHSPSVLAAGGVVTVCRRRRCRWRRPVPAAAKRSPVDNRLRLDERAHVVN